MEFLWQRDSSCVTNILCVYMHGACSDLIVVTVARNTLHCINCYRWKLWCEVVYAKLH